MKEQGKVLWFDPELGFGYITRNDKSKVFLPYSALAGEGFKNISDGSLVEFEVVKERKGPKAFNVVKLN